MRRVPGYVERVLVDRGSVVKEGRTAGGVERAGNGRPASPKPNRRCRRRKRNGLQAEAQLAAAQSTYDRLKKAAETPGAIAGNEVIQAEKQVEAAQALVRSRQQASRAAQAAVRRREGPGRRI